ncbi:MAG: hypothetical protein CMM08_16255 [Rhodospirillaceae bacterium]|nr:hypothetical protein [Rhodospirillaceae bacterium]|tara:strand:- start:593 stop:904 length:312 start_codon:yes stop_codon:yes gene_type:complete
MIGLIHSHPATGASIAAQPAVKLVIVKSIQMASDFRQPFGSNLSGFEGGQAGGIGPCPTQSPVTEQARQRTEQTADGSDARTAIENSIMDWIRGPFAGECMGL